MKFTATLLLILGVTTPTGAAPAIGLQLIAADVPLVIDIQHAGDGSGRLFLVSQSGRILIHDGSNVLGTPFLDVTSIVSIGSERGLLGVAFHPRYGDNGLFYVNYTNLAGDTVVARYQVSSDPNVANPASATILLTQTQPFTNHNGGQLRFGPDGFLYIALGDGGSASDPQNNGQRLDTLLGKLLRIDVDSAAPYAIPAANPFVNTSGARGEIWAYGLRNPWRFTFDRLTGDLFIADVGQNAWEEVDFESAGGGGGRNYGWRVMEGRHCHNPSSGCNTTSLSLPILEYSHEVGCSISGGFRYRGSGMAAFAGTYFFADLCSGSIWGARPGISGTWSATQLLDTSMTVTTFGEDQAGELYVVHYNDHGQLYRLVASPTPLPVLSVAKAGNGTGVVTSSPSMLDCRDICAAQLPANTVVTLLATPDAGYPFVGWSGDADCADGSVTLSSDRTCTATFGTGFTDDPLAAGTFIRKIHITELRSRIDAARAARGLGAFPWTDQTLTAGSTVVHAVHITELRAALNEALMLAGRPLPSYTDPELATGMTVKAAHVSELRAAVVSF
jgi:glucose/arabinose dehydrogenase